MTDERTRTPVRGVPIRRAATEGRPRRPSEEHGWSRFEQTALIALEGLQDAVGDLVARVTKLELVREREDGAAQERAKLWRWVTGLLAAAIIALLAAYVRSIQ